MKGDRGTALVEFALVAPVFMLLLVAMIDIGKGFNYWIDQTHLANMGARWAVVGQNPGSGSLQEYVASLADTPELKSGGSSSLPAGVSVCVLYPGKSFATAVVGDPVEVDVVSTYHWVPLVGGAVGGPSLKLKSTATMRLEQPPSADPANDVNGAGC